MSINFILDLSITTYGQDVIWAESNDEYISIDEPQIIIVLAFIIAIEILKRVHWRVGINDKENKDKALYDNNFIPIDFFVIPRQSMNDWK